MDDLSERTARAIADAERVLFVTGAGLSADSGLPTYRGVSGLYERGQTEEGFAIEDVLSGPMFRARPELTWKYLREIEAACRGARPSPGHHAIRDLEREDLDVVVLTQNVDGLHRAAGSSKVIEIHGSLSRLLCTGCGHRVALAGDASLPVDPRCADCGAPERPDVVLFGEALPEAALADLDRELREGFDVVLSVGTSSGFPYIQAPVFLAARQGMTTVEINPSETPVSHAVLLRLPARAADVLPNIVTRAIRLRQQRR